MIHPYMLQPLRVTLKPRFSAEYTNYKSEKFYIDSLIKLAQYGTGTIS